MRGDWRLFRPLQTSDVAILSFCDLFLMSLKTNPWRVEAQGKLTGLVEARQPQGLVPTFQTLGRRPQAVHMMGEGVMKSGSSRCAMS
jgi:hypothetical protein